MKVIQARGYALFAGPLQWFNGPRVALYLMSTLQIREEPSSTAPLSPHRPLQEFYATPAARSKFVNQLFDEAAPDYDWVSGAMSFWTDQAYRREALQRAGLLPGMKLLDVASGTGLMIKASLELGLNAAHVTGLDPSLGMLEQNRRRNAVSLLQGRGERLPFRDATFDFLCMGYALRHVEDLRAIVEAYGPAGRGGLARIVQRIPPRAEAGGEAVDPRNHAPIQPRSVGDDASLHAKSSVGTRLAATKECNHSQVDEVLLGDHCRMRSAGGNSLRAPGRRLPGCTPHHDENDSE